MKIDTNKLIQESYEDFLTSREKAYLSFFILLFFVLIFDIVPRDIILTMITIVFTISSLKSSSIMYMFFSLWENVAVSTFGLTLNVALKIVLCIKILANLMKVKPNISLKYLDVLVLLVVGYYGIMNVIVGTGDFSGIEIGCNVLIAIYLFNIYKDKKEYLMFWKKIFLILMLSTLLSVLYGIINNTSLNRWISGMGYIPQIYGTIGTARIGMFLCASLIYPVFYSTNRLIKIMLSILLSGLALMTLSITTTICLLLFWTVVLAFKEKKGHIGLRVPVAIIFILITIILLGPKIKEISLVKPIIIRIENIIKAFKAGDMHVATSSRFTLLNKYISDFKELPVINKVFGSFYVNRVTFSPTGQYAHNSYVDILLYSGIIGLVSFILVLVKKIRFHRNKSEFLPIMLLKLIFLITGLSVSMLTSTFWFLWLIL
ncbi:MAG: hypothetical protein GX995_09010 [Clostridiales bacterium]|nr:hypothetical protein [Clostridiales bacterium]